MIALKILGLYFQHVADLLLQSLKKYVRLIMISFKSFCMGFLVKGENTLGNEYSRED